MSIFVSVKTVSKNIVNTIYYILVDMFCFYVFEFSWFGYLARQICRQTLFYKVQEAKDIAAPPVGQITPQTN